MHAHVVSVDITDAEAAVKGLEELVPTVKASPGFVAGYWIRLDDSHGTSIAVFETEEQARAAAPPVGGEHGRRHDDRVQIGEVSAAPEAARGPAGPRTTVGRVSAPRYRCDGCGNLTRFDVTVSQKTKAFHHYTRGRRPRHRGRGGARPQRGRGRLPLVRPRAQRGRDHRRGADGEEPGSPASPSKVS